MQKSMRNGSHGISVAWRVAVIDGTGVGGNGVLVGITFVFTTTGVTVASIFVQDARINNRKMPNVCFIKVSCHCEGAQRPKQSPNKLGIALPYPLRLRSLSLTSLSAMLLA